MNKPKSLLIILLVFGTVFFFKDNLTRFYAKLTQELPQIEKFTTSIITEEIGKEIFSPPPLISKENAGHSILTKNGVITWTNAQRSDSGLPKLAENEKLNASAALKLKDMFDKQYFEHISPSGVGIKDLAGSAGYEYIVIGENLAMGNFKDDKNLVEAWMNSPGHRANILNARFREIGVAVGRGLFEGKSVWMAVQHFGMPLSSCLKPDEALLKKIKNGENEIAALQKNLEARRAKIESAKFINPGEYEREIKIYNSLIDRYNGLINETKNLVNSYNNQIGKFNTCVAR